jgi:hypothetical protein
VRHTRIVVTHYGGPDVLQVIEEECELGRVVVNGTYHLKFWFQKSLAEFCHEVMIVSNQNARATGSHEGLIHPSGGDNISASTGPHVAGIYS